MQGDDARLKEHLARCEHELKQCMSLLKKEGNRVERALDEALSAVQKARMLSEASPSSSTVGEFQAGGDVTAVITRVKAQVKQFIHETLKG